MFLASVAQDYVRLLNEGETSVINALAEQLEIGRNTVTDVLRQCRSDGFLTSTGRGRAGGSLTKQATDVILKVGNESLLEVFELQDKPA